MTVVMAVRRHRAFESLAFMQHSLESVPRQQTHASGALARWLGALACGLAIGIVGVFVVPRASLPYLPAGETLLVALAAVLAWFVIAAWQRRQGSVQPAQPHGPLLHFDRADTAPVPVAAGDVATQSPPAVAPIAAALEVAFASQTGFAEQL